MAHKVKHCYTLSQIRAMIDSGEHNAELLLMHAMIRIGEVEEDLAMRVEQVRNAVSERDRYKAQAEQKRMLAREFESILGFTEEQAREEGAISEAVKRIRELKGNQCEKDLVFWIDPLHYDIPHNYKTKFCTEPLYRKAK